MPASRIRRRIVSALVVSSAAVATMALGTATADAVTVAPTLSWSPTTSSNTFDFGTVRVDAASTQAFTLRNSGLLPTGRLSVSLTGSSAFAVTADSCTGKNLAYNKTCSVTLRYAPGTVGDSVATLSAGSAFGARASLTLRGTGAPTKGTLTASWLLTRPPLTVSGSGLLPGSEVDVHYTFGYGGQPYDYAVGMADAQGTFSWSEHPPCVWRDVYFTGTDSFGTVTSNTISVGQGCGG